MRNPLSIEEKTNACELEMSQIESRLHDLATQHAVQGTVAHGRFSCRRWPARGGAWLPCSGACQSVERPKMRVTHLYGRIFDFGIKHVCEIQSFGQKQSINAIFKVIQNPYKCVAFKLSSCGLIISIKSKDFY